MWQVLVLLLLDQVFLGVSSIVMQSSDCKNSTRKKRPRREESKINYRHDKTCCYCCLNNCVSYYCCYCEVMFYLSLSRQNKIESTKFGQYEHRKTKTFVNFQELDRGNEFIPLSNKSAP